MELEEILNINNLDKNFFIFMFIIFNSKIFNFYYIISNINVIIFNQLLEYYLYDS